MGSFRGREKVKYAYTAADISHGSCTYLTSSGALGIMHSYGHWVFVIFLRTILLAINISKESCQKYRVTSV